MIRQAIGTERAAHAVQAVHVAFALVGIAMDLAGDEEIGLQQRPQPRRATVLVPHPHHRTNLTTGTANTLP